MREEDQRRIEFTLERLAIPLDERVKAFGVKTPIIKFFGTWAVTPYGVESLIEDFAIPFEDVHDPDWWDEMRGKWWVAIIEFMAALRYARKLAAKTKKKKVKGKSLPLSVRFKVLRRDGFRCQICGKSAGDDVKLEVDHKKPKSKGGSNDPSNLWTLCFDCNRGKGAKELNSGGGQTSD